MTRPLGSTPTAPSRNFAATTGRSAGAPRNGTHCLTGSAGLTGSLSPTRTRVGRYRGTPSHVPCSSSRPDSRRLHAGHHLANRRAPARLIPGQLGTPGFDATSCVTALHQRPHDPVELRTVFPVPT